MKRIITLYGIAVMSALTFTAMSVATASAEETKLLPEPTTANPITDQGTQGGSEGHLLTTSGFEVQCLENGSAAESWASANLATLAVLLFNKCTSSLSSKCTGEGLGTGLIEVSGEAHFWLGLLMTGKIGSEGSELISALVFLNKEVKFICVNLAKTFERTVVVKPGCVAAQDLPASLNKLVATVLEMFTAWAPSETKGETAILSVLPAGSTSEIPCLMKLTENAGLERLASLTFTFAFSNYKQNSNALTIELMK
jgi:hypothetical protein